MDTKNISDLPVSLDFLPYTYLIAECRLCCFAAEENLGRRDRRKTLLSLVFLKNNTCRSDFLELNKTKNCPFDKTTLKISRLLQNYT